MKSISVMAVAALCAAPVAAQECLFAYFGAGRPGMHYALSRDAEAWTPLLDIDPVLLPEGISNGCLRDPQIARGPDSLYHVVFTGGLPTHIGHATSPDLLHWTACEELPLMEGVAGTRNCWAPEAHYLPGLGKWLLIWSSTVDGAHTPVETAPGERGWNHRIYYSLTTDWRSFSPPALFFNPSWSCIDATLLRLDNGRWLFAVKNENSAPPAKYILVGLLPRDWGDNEAGLPLSATLPLQIVSPAWSEGPALLLWQGWTYLYFDRYTENAYGVLRSRDLRHWQRVERVSFPAGMRHGSALVVDAATAERLTTKGGE